MKISYSGVNEGNLVLIDGQQSDVASRVTQAVRCPGTNPKKNSGSDIYTMLEIINQISHET